MRRSLGGRRLVTGATIRGMAYSAANATPHADRRQAACDLNHVKQRTRNMLRAPCLPDSRPSSSPSAARACRGEEPHPLLEDADQRLVRRQDRRRLRDPLLPRRAQAPPDRRGDVLERAGRHQAGAPEADHPGEQRRHVDDDHDRRRRGRRRLERKRLAAASGGSGGSGSSSSSGSGGSERLRRRAARSATP